MNLSWQKRRGEFNHDWMKNKYIQALRDWRRLLNDEQEDEELERNFVSDVLPQWELFAEEAIALPRDFEMEMSPRVLFKDLPLSRCDENTKQWLGEVIHELWLVRYSIRQLIADARSKAENTKLSYARLKDALKGCANTRNIESLRPVSSLFDEFCKCCEALAGAIEKLPNEVKAI